MKSEKSPNGNWNYGSGRCEKWRVKSEKSPNGIWNYGSGRCEEWRARNRNRVSAIFHYSLFTLHFSLKKCNSHSSFFILHSSFITSPPLHEHNKPPPPINSSRCLPHSGLSLFLPEERAEELLWHWFRSLFRPLFRLCRLRPPRCLQEERRVG